MDRPSSSASARSAPTTPLSDPISIRDARSEWPFDAPTLTRFFLYVAIPLGSWLGGALVERLLGAALDIPLDDAAVWDLGANTGEFTRLAAQRGIPAVAFDIDPAAVEDALQRWDLA
mgnify:CR=1 FL=1